MHCCPKSLEDFILDVNKSFYHNLITSLRTKKKTKMIMIMIMIMMIILNWIVIRQSKNFRAVLPSFGRFLLLFSVHFPNWLSNLAPQSAEKSRICRGIVRDEEEDSLFVQSNFKSTQREVDRWGFQNLASSVRAKILYTWPGKRVQRLLSSLCAKSRRGVGGPG